MREAAKKKAEQMVEEITKVVKKGNEKAVKMENLVSEQRKVREEAEWRAKNTGGCTEMGHRGAQK